MNYKEIKVQGFLEHFIQCFWYYENMEGETYHTILPDGHFDLLVLFIEDKLAGITLTGIWTEPKNIYIRKNTKYFAIRFKLLAAEYLFKREIKTLLNNMTDLPDDYWGIDCYKSTEFDRFVNHITKNIESSLKRCSEIDKRKLQLFDLAYHHRVGTVAELSNRTSWNTRSINRYFNARFGFSLKEFLRILRLKTSYKDIAKGTLQPNDQYFDQSHFIKEVKKYAGVTPKELYKNNCDRFLQKSTVDK